MRTIGFFGLRPGRYRHSDYLAGRGYNNSLRQQVLYRRFKNRDRSLNQSDGRERGFNRI
jgi:hypothetical protein